MSKRRISILLLIILVANCLAVRAWAHPVPDLTKKGTIEITMRHGSEMIPGGTLTIYRVGQIHEEDGNYSYVLTGDFEGSGISLENLQSASVPEALAEYAESKALKGQTKDIGQDGKVRFEDIELGLYLFVQEEAAQGYNTANPFVVSLPGKQNGEYIYQVDGSPKLDPITEKPTTGPTEPPETKPSGPNLPQTGQLNWPIPMMAIVGLSLFVFGWLLFFRRKKEDYET